MLNKLLRLLIIIPFISLFPPAPVSAHVGGVPIVSINGVLVNAYFPSSLSTLFSSSPFDLPPDTDLAAQNYTVDQSLEFKLDTTKLRVTQDSLERVILSWDLGDGSPTQTGPNMTAVSHSYAQAGTFIVTAFADYSAIDPSIGTQPLQTLLLHVLPSSDYRLPQPVISLNGQNSSDGQNSSFQLDLNHKVVFDASGSKPGSSKIINYRWDFDDNTQAEKKSVCHEYSLPRFLATPVLRVTDENGYFVDTTASISNTGDNSPKEVRPIFNDCLVWNTKDKLVIVISAVLIAVAGFALVMRRSNKK